MAADIRARAETFGIGFWVALLILVADVILAFMGIVDRDPALVIAAICAVRL